MVRLRAAQVAPTAFMAGDLVLLPYLVRPPSKLSVQWAGPFRIRERKANTAILEDMTGGAQKSVDISRLKLFLLGPGVDPQAVAAADMVLAYRGLTGSVRKRSTLQYQV